MNCIKEKKEMRLEMEAYKKRIIRLHVSSSLNTTDHTVQYYIFPFRIAIVDTTKCI